jgi:hypothetical protein
MRNLISGLVLAILGTMALGCAGSGGAQSGAQPGARAGSSASTNPCVMQSEGRDVLRLTVPADATCTPKDGSLRAESHARDIVDVWLVRGAKTVEEGAGRVSQEISSEFKGFKTTSTTPLTIAGAPAKRIMGSGAEADDGDPGSADVVVFKAGEHVFVACTHGESLSPVSQQWMMTVVQTAQAP